MTDPSVTVRPINQEILGMGGSNNLIQQIIPSIGLISEATFRPGDENNKFSFRTAGQTVGRLGIFAARKGTLERAVIMLLPESGTPERVLICITQGFEQAHDALGPLGWSNPLSRPFIEFCLLKHVINRWGPQMLAARKSMALMYIVRARGNELGPFANDGPFVREVLTEIAALTAGAFSFDTVEAFTFSSGIGEFNTFLRSIGGVLNLQAVYNIDPAHGVLAGGPSGIVRRQFLSGQTSGGPRPAFEYMPVPRWENEWEYPRRETFPNPWRFNYMHNHCMPRYTLHLGIQIS